MNFVEQCGNKFNKTACKDIYIQQKSFSFPSSWKIPAWMPRQCPSPQTHFPLIVRWKMFHCNQDRFGKNFTMVQTSKLLDLCKWMGDGFRVNVLILIEENFFTKWSPSKMSPKKTGLQGEWDQNEQNKIAPPTSFSNGICTSFSIKRKNFSLHLQAVDRWKGEQLWLMHAVTRRQTK